MEKAIGPKVRQSQLSGVLRGSSMLFANDGMELFISSQEDSWIAGFSM